MPNATISEVSHMPDSSDSKAETSLEADKPAVGETPSVEVFAVFGAEPEIQAYAMAKYSRSALSMKESLKEISQQRAEKFLNTFYFQYGHRSIADLAHIALAVEKLSILAAIELADEQRWDGQERSTRYQDFKKSGCFIPDFGSDEQARTLYCETVDFLLAEYEALSAHMTQHLISITPKPADMKQECAHPGNAGVASALAHACRSAAAGRAAQEGRDFTGLQRQCRVAA